MVLHQGDHNNSDDEDDVVNAAEKVPTDYMVKMCEMLTAGPDPWARNYIHLENQTFKTKIIANEVNDSGGNMKNHPT